MGYYKYCIRKNDDGYFFELLPNNGNGQAIGKSNSFNTYQEAKEKLLQFQSFVVSNGETAFKILTTDNKKYLFTLIENEYQIQFFRIAQLEYTTKVNVNKAINNIIKNINAPLIVL